MNHKERKERKEMKPKLHGLLRGAGYGAVLCLSMLATGFVMHVAWRCLVVGWRLVELIQF